MKTDTKGRAYAKLSQTKAGDKVQADAGFTCIKPNAILEVKESPDGLYVRCRSGRHYLNGQADDGEHITGLYPIGEKMTIHRPDGFINVARGDNAVFYTWWLCSCGKKEETKEALEKHIQQENDHGKDN